MILNILDWIIIGLFLLVSLSIGLLFSKKASKDITQFFLGGRNLPWWIAGTSMVATTFAADTPLAVTELVAQNGISGNWLWWSFLIGGMFTTFFFSKFWRKSGVLTDLEFIELRYSGKEAKFLRGFRALYLGLFMNVLIIGWVNLALMSLLKVFFDIPEEQLIYYCGGAMLIVAIYSSLSGLLGVAFTDVIQFVIAMVGTILLSIYVLDAPQIGGINGLISKLDESSLSFFPKIGEDSGQKLSLTIGGFLSFVAIQWWASWYPGAEPGGGGYIAQRMMSTKNEKHALISTLFFQIAHYCIRPWPWILVALCSLVLYPNLAEADVKLGYVYAMRDFLPAGLRGLLIVAFFSAYMSTISTQLNWGASYLVNDFYVRFSNKKLTNKKLVNISRLITIILMLVALAITTQLETISGVWSFIIECGAGLGLVLILRWFWWRVNAWGEIVATIVPFISYAFCKFYLENELGEDFINNSGTYFVTVGFTVIAFFITIYLTPKTDESVLKSFYSKIQPMGFWSGIGEKGNNQEFIYLLISWISAVLFAYSFLFLTGYLILGFYSDMISWLLIAIVSLAGIIFCNKKINLI